MTTNSPISDKDRELDKSRWQNLVTSPNFQAIIDYAENRKKVLHSENKAFKDEPSLTNLNKISANLARVGEIDALLARANFQKNELNKGRK